MELGSQPTGEAMPLPKDSGVRRGIGWNRFREMIAPLMRHGSEVGRECGCA